MAVTPDKTYKLNGVTVNEYFITKHNPNDIDLPDKRTNGVRGVTIHNTGRVSTSLTQAEVYTLSTRNGNMRDTRVFAYIDEYGAWLTLPEDYMNWACADGTNSNSGNNTTLSLELCMDGSTGKTNDKVADNGARLAAYYLHKYGLGIDKLYKHQDWYAPKVCPIYLIPIWTLFRNKVKDYLDQLNGKTSTTTSTSTSTQTYRIRKSWSDAKSQIGAYTSLENAKKACKDGYSVFDNNGNVVYTTSTTSKSAAATTTVKPNITYCVYTNQWYPSVTNYNTTNDDGYAGVENQSVRGLAAKVSKGTLKYRVHLKDGGWLSWIDGYNTSDWAKGCAGLKTRTIDGIQAYLTGVSGYEVKYRVSTTGSKDYLPWVVGASDFAGIFGQNIDKVQMEIVKK